MRKFTLTLANEQLQLLPQRALWLPAHGALVVADVHVGKAATFRALGVPVPHGTTEDNLQRLDQLLNQTAARQLIFLGDLFHAPQAHVASAAQALHQWRHKHAAVKMLLVEGNHDQKAGPPSAALDLQLVDEPFALGGLQLSHHPQKYSGQTVLAGHMHPCIRLYGAGGDSARLPCFWLQTEQASSQLLVLPAFGAFTGGALVTRAAGDRVFAVADDRLFEIPNPVRAAA